MRTYCDWYNLAFIVHNNHKTNKTCQITPFDLQDSPVVIESLKDILVDWVRVNLDEWIGKPTICQLQPMWLPC